MKKQVYEIDGNGLLKEIYVAEVDENGKILDEDKVDFISIDPPHGLFKPKWNGTEWIEGATQEEIDELTKPQPSLPTVDERIEQLENMILMMMEVM